MTPREIIPLANAAVFDSGRSGINMTFFIGIIDFESRTMTYANAAHCPPPARDRLPPDSSARSGDGPWSRAPKRAVRWGSSGAF